MNIKNIGIAIPTYNRVELLTELVRSIPESIEVSISDNGCYVPEDFFAEHENIKIKKHQQVIDMFENWNSAAKSIGNSEFISFASDDDFYIKDKFSIIVEEINKVDADIYIFGHKLINEKNTVIGEYCPKRYEVLNSPEGLNYFLYSVDARMVSVFFSKRFLEEFGYFDSKTFKITAADSELVQRALLMGKAVYIPEVVAFYRVWSGGLTDQKIATKHWMDEIDDWTNKIRKLAVEKLPERANQYNWDTYQDEVFARNLLAGIANLCRAGKYKEAIIHFKAMRFPNNALLKTKLRLLKYLSLAYIKRFYAR